VLVHKELRELVTMQMLAPFIAVIGIFFALSGIIGSAGEDAASAQVTVIDNDKTAYSAVVVASLESVGLAVDIAEGTVEDVVSAHTGKGTALFVQVPSGFAESLSAGESGGLEIRTVMSDFSLMGTQSSAQLQAGLSIAGQALVTQVMTNEGVDLPVTLVQQPLRVTESVTVGEKTAATSAAAVAGFISQQTVFIPIVLFVVIVFAAQLIATTIATEKENKTLETLLSYPISRTALVTAKMVAAGIVSLLAAGAYMVGMRQYMTGLETGMGGGSSQGVSQAKQMAMRELGLTLGATDYVTLGLSLFAGILLALSIAIILGAFAESVRAVSALITPLMVLLMVPYLLTMFVNLETASPVLKWVVLAIPFTHPFVAAQNLFLGNDVAVWAGTGYQVIWFVAFAIIAARIFSSDRILTMKLALQGRK